jgi:hypothetical protein
MFTSLALALLSHATIVFPAQSPVADSALAQDTLILAHEFSGPGLEFTRVKLHAGQVYRVEVDGGRDIRIRALRSGEQAPRFGQTEPYPRASRTVAFEVIPFVTTIYEIRVGSIPRGVAPLRIYWDANATARRQKLLALSQRARP